MTHATTSFLLAGAIITIGGSLAYGYYTAFYTYVPGVRMSGLPLAEHIVLCASVGTSVFLFEVVGYFLLRAVRGSRVSRWLAALYCGLCAAVITFLPVALMMMSRAIWPHAYRGDAGFNFLAALFVTAPILMVLFVAFAVALVANRNARSKNIA